MVNNEQSKKKLLVLTYHSQKTSPPSPPHSWPKRKVHRTRPSQPPLPSRQSACLYISCRWRQRVCRWLGWACRGRRWWGLSAGWGVWRGRDGLRCSTCEVGELVVRLGGWGCGLWSRVEEDLWGDMDLEVGFGMYVCFGMMFWVVDWVGGLGEYEGYIQKSSELVTND